MRLSRLSKSKISHTAQAVAAARYLASQDPATGVRDHEASWYLGRFFKTLSHPSIKKAAMAIYNRLVPGMVPFYIVRVHHYDQRIRNAVRERGVKQVCILGAGYDNRALRLAGDLTAAGTLLYEVDRAETQEHKKRALLRNLAGTLPPHVRYVTCDLLRDTLSDKLLRAGWRSDVPSFVMAEGLVYYLNPDTFDATLEALRSVLHEGSAFGFDYPVAGVIRGERGEYPELVAAMDYARRVSNEIFIFDAIEAGEESLRAYVEARNLAMGTYWDHASMVATYFQWLGPSIPRWGALPTGFNIAEVGLG